jgi:hypothetical protein
VGGCNGQPSDDEPELFDELLAPEPPEPPESEELLEDSDFVEPVDESLLEVEELGGVELGGVEPDDESALVDVDGFLPRLSVLKKPDPLNVTPTGVNTFFTGRRSPESGCAISVKASSWNPCRTSIVSPESMNL